MKNLSSYIILSAFALLVVAALISPNVSMGAGWERSLHVEWGYTPPSKTDETLLMRVRDEQKQHD